MPALVFLVILFLVFVLVSSYFIYRFYLKFREGRKIEVIDYSQLSFELQEFDDLIPFNSNEKKYQAQSDGWKKLMLNNGEMLRDSGVQKIIFVHGTFVGDDPFEIFNLLKHQFPRLGKKLEQRFRKSLKSHQDRILKDIGNFSSDYVSLFSEALGQLVKCDSFIWSSANNHLARVMGALALAKKLEQDIKNERLNKVLLIGHSHAGQVFALLTKFIIEKDFLTEILDELSLLEDERQQFVGIFQTIRKKKISMDFATYGCAPRYDWGVSKLFRTLHIVNHRGKGPVPGGFRGILNTLDGDYVQLIAVEGSDTAIPVKDQEKINRELEQYLGMGRNLSVWSRKVQQKNRISRFGHTLLVDYKDASLIPNFLQSIFGHGIYTRFRVMAYNTTVIVNYFYKDQS